MDVRPVAASHPAGYVVALVGVVGFVVSCFLPYLGGAFLPPGGTISLFRLVALPSVRGAQLGGVIYLFAGAATTGVISIIGLYRARTWTPYALVAGVAAWTLTWVGVLISQWAFGPHETGYWTLYASLGVGIVGAIVVWVSSRSHEREPAPSPA